MSSTRSPILAGLLAIAMVTSLVPLLPTAAASGENLQKCEGDTLIHREGGFVALSHPSSNNARVSEALFFHVFSQQNPTVFGDGLRAWTNGLDAYVVHLGCNTDGNEWYCLEHQDPEPSEGFPILADQPDGSVPDARIQFYSAALGQVGDEFNPTPEREDEYCSSPGAVPADAHYAVIYLRDGIPEGLQFSDQLFGTYTMDFSFELHRQ